MDWILRYEIEECGFIFFYIFLGYLFSCVALSRWRGAEADYRTQSPLVTLDSFQWSKCLKDVESTEDSVTVQFEDGSSCIGSILAACDGSRSRVRSILYPSNYRNYKLPIRFLGVTAHYSAEQAARVRAIDPLFFQGTDSTTDAYLYFSCMSLDIS